VTSRSELEALIHNAFEGAQLGGGLSLQQAELIDDMDWRDRLTQAEFDAIPAREVTDDWTALTADDLATKNVAHLDPEGLRYYLPGLMLRLLDDYDPGEMWVIGTIHALDQRDRHPRGFVELLTPAQRRAIAEYIRVVPTLVDLRKEDAAVLRRSFDTVWSRYADPATGSSS
jgi:hypothetical protein